MIDAARTYRELFEQLLFERALSGGHLPQEREVELTAELDRFWHDMTVTEQDEAERRFAGERSPKAPDAFNFIDVALHAGEHVAPRRAA